LRLEAQTIAADNVTLNKVRDSLNLETKNLLDQLRTAALLQEKISALKIQCDDITKDRDPFELKSRRSDANYKDLRRILEALKFERGNLRAKRNEHDLREEQIKVLRLQCANIVEERDYFVSSYLRSEANNQDTRNVMETMKVEREELRTQLNNYGLLEKQVQTVRRKFEDITNQRNTYILRAQKAAECKGAIMIEKDNLKLETEKLRANIKDVDLLEKKLNAAKLLCDKIKRERDVHNLNAQWSARSRGATREDIKVLKRVAENPSVQHYDVALQEEQVNVVRDDCGNITKDFNTRSHTHRKR
jgi:hypothetical protein